MKPKNISTGLWFFIVYLGVGIFFILTESKFIGYGFIGVGAISYVISRFDFSSDQKDYAVYLEERFVKEEVHPFDLLAYMENGVLNQQYEKTIQIGEVLFRKYAPDKAEDLQIGHYYIACAHRALCQYEKALFHLDQATEITIKAIPEEQTKQLIATTSKIEKMIKEIHSVQLIATTSKIEKTTKEIHSLQEELQNLKD